jgi:hypothetical protein
VKRKRRRRNEDQRQQRLDDLEAYRARTGAGVGIETAATSERRLVDQTGQDRSDMQMERDVAKAAMLGRAGQ